MVDLLYNNSDNDLGLEAHYDPRQSLYNFFHEKCNADYDISIQRQFSNDLINGDLHYKTHVGSLFSKGSLASNQWSLYQEELLYNMDVAKNGYLMPIISYYLIDPFLEKIFNLKDNNNYTTHMIEMSPMSSHVRGMYTSQGNDSTYYTKVELDPDNFEVKENFCASIGCGEYRYEIDTESIKVEENVISFHTGKKHESIPEGLEGKVEVTIKKKYTWF